jgi:diguanylate cyclase (GGDEF)-like protein
MIDVRTLLALLALADLVLAVAVVFAAGRRPRDGMGMWAGSLAVRSLALLLFSRSELHSANLALAAGLLALSITLQAGALLGFDRRRLPAWLHTAVIAALAVPFAVLTDATVAVLFGGVVYGTLLAGLAAFAWQVRPPTARSRSILVAAFALAAIAFYARGLGAMVASDPLRIFLAPTPFQSATFLVAAVAALVSSFGFLLLHKERAESEALRLATMDPLTGMYNRRTFHEMAEREMSRARRGSQPLSIVLVDIDHFRTVNDRYGHRVGDAVLQQLADIVRSALRQEDMLVRFGGEEILVMLPDVPGPGAVVVAGRIRRAVATSEIRVEGHDIPITVSAGVAARLDEGPESIDSLIARADEALSLAKRRGRNRVVALSLGRSIAA